MASEYFRASKEMVDLVTEVREMHHEPLADARIGIIVRGVAPQIKGKRGMAKVRKVSAEEQLFMPYDFLIWFADDIWQELNAFQRRALVDHELCHCRWTNEKPKLVGHDLEEFRCIIERYGFWWPFAEEDEQVFQARLGLGGLTGRTEAVQMDILTEVKSIFASDEPEFDTGRNPYHEEEGEEKPSKWEDGGEPLPRLNTPEETAALVAALTPSQEERDSQAEAMWGEEEEEEPKPKTRKAKEDA